jgi:hypothetical protein
MEKDPPVSNSRPCQWEGCDKEGIYSAPRSPGDLETRQYFCLEHIRQYNANWDYFQSHSEEEIIQFMQEAVVGHRPVWSNDNHSYRQQLKQRLQQEGNRSRSQFNRLRQKEKGAFSLLGLDSIVEWDQVKLRYKELVKQHHPDVNKTQDEEKLKAINQAYALLRRFYKSH